MYLYPGRPFNTKNRNVNLTVWCYQSYDLCNPNIWLPYFKDRLSLLLCIHFEDRCELYNLLKCPLSDL